MRAPSPTRVSIAVLAALALLIAGCGSSSDETGGGEATPSTTLTAPSGIKVKECDAGSPGATALRVTGGSCPEGRKVVAAWAREPDCSNPPGASRYSCKVDGLTCLGANAGQGIVVTCAEAGRSIAFMFKRG